MTLIRLESDTTQKQQVEMVRSLLSTLKGKEFDGITAARFFMETWGIYGDHHLFTDVMDYMTRTGQARVSQPGGYTKFIIL